MVVFNKKCNCTWWEISGPEKATIAIVGKGGSLEGMDNMKKNMFPFTDFSKLVI